jgi:predicted ATP-dependent protease
VTRVIEQLARWAGDAERLSTQLEDLAHLVRESDHRARGEGAAAIEKRHVQAAIDAHRRRSGRTRERVHEAIARGDLLIDTHGAVVGQVNGLTVALTGDQAFAFPTRITANTRVGEGDVVDIQREVELSGPIHSKGVLILASLLTTRYSPTRPLSLSATLVFEQTYGAVDGDSASVAELCALLSSIGGFALDQGVAVTGAIDQHGRVLPIGAVNDKIEGFFDVCAARGLTGRQGVLIPPANVKHLMLRTDVIDAVARGEFRVVAVATLDEALSVLAGTDAGTPDARGVFPAGTPNARVAARLTEYAERRQAMLGPPVAVRLGAPRRRGRRVPGRRAPGRQGS